MIKPGEKHHNVKLTEQKVLGIRHAYKQEPTPEKRKELSITHGVNHRTISSIINRERWKHI